MASSVAGSGSAGAPARTAGLGATLSLSRGHEVMAETFFVVGNGNPRAVTAIRRKADGTTQTLDQAVPDGDTVGVQLDGTGSTRFLGIDTPRRRSSSRSAAARRWTGPSGSST